MRSAARRPRAVFALVASGLLLGFAGCAKRVPLPTAALDDAQARYAKGSATARDLAVLGLHAVVVQGDVEQGRTLGRAALAQDKAEPYALYLDVLLARRATDVPGAVRAALTLLERAPQHPLAGVAARVLFEKVGVATSLDAEVRERGGPIVGALKGDAAHLFKAVLALVAKQAGDAAAHARFLVAAGIPTSATLVGPFSAYDRLSTVDVTEPERSGRVDGLGTGPVGPLTPRVLRFGDARLVLTGEAGPGDGYVVAWDVTVDRAGPYLLRTFTTADHVAVLDGTRVFERQAWPQPAPTVTARVVTLDAGAHRLVLRFHKERGNGLGVALTPVDGSGDGVRFAPAQGAPPRWSGVAVDAPPPSVAPSAQALFAQLAPETSEGVARFIAAQDAASRDRDGARRLLGVDAALDSPALLVLRAQLPQDERSLPAKVARGLATRDLEAALVKDPGNAAALAAQAHLALDDGRLADALERVKAAQKAAGAPSVTLLTLEARVLLAMSLESEAAQVATHAEAVLPGACDAAELRYDVARRRDAVADAEARLKALRGCPGARGTEVEHRRGRGQLDDALALLAAQVAGDDTQLDATQRLAQLQLAAGKGDAAVETLTRLRGVWPRHPGLGRALADTLEQVGRKDDALRVREEVLLLDGGDLKLRRAVHRARTGKELLDEYAITADEALKAYEAAPGVEDVTSAILLDAAAIRAFPDGSMVDRIHIIQKALDQNGVQEIAEVSLPPGAEVLTLRTLKADGRVEEPESIDGKDAVSMSGVQVGDMVEYEYLLAHPSRGPTQPGFTAGAFYFQVARQPNNWSTYVVAAPKGAGLKVDAHNVDAPQPVVEGELEVLRHERKRVPPYIPEPVGPPSGNEWLPFVVVGAGQTGQEGVVKAFADAFLDKGEVTVDVEVFAKKAAGDATGRELIRRVHAAVMQQLSGRDSGLGVSAAASVRQDRGSRTWLLYSALKALGVDVRLVAVRGFTADPAPYLFPTEALLPYVCLRVTLPDGELWLDAAVRFGPLGELPEFALGGREAYVLPEPGKPLEAVKTPPRPERPAKVVTLELSLSEDGVLTGTGSEAYQGIEAAQLAEALESMPKDQRDQALQQSLSRYFGGADLSSLEVEAKREVGATATVKYGFKAPRFARKEGDRLVLSPLTFPVSAGRRYLALSQRTTPLFIDGTEASRTVVTLKLPGGWVVKDPLDVLERTVPQGRYVRREKQDGDVLKVEEEFRLVQSRVPPKEYGAFGRFVGEVDLIQARDLLLERAAAK